MAKNIREYEVVMSSETPRLWLERHGERVSPDFYNERGDEWSLRDLLSWAYTAMPEACDVIRAQLAGFNEEPDAAPPEEELYATIISLEAQLADYSFGDETAKHKIVETLKRMLKIAREMPEISLMS